MKEKKIREGEQPSGLPMGGFLSLTSWPDPGGGSRVVPLFKGDSALPPFSVTPEFLPPSQPMFSDDFYL